MTNEKSVAKVITNDSINKDMTSGATRNDYPLQRYGGNWNSVKKGNLCSDILQGNPIPEIILCEEVNADGFSTDWIIDGKQRTETIRDFINNKLAITKSARCLNIPYIHYEKDAKGNVTHEEKWFNIKNKKFKDLPEELKTQFLKYELRYVKYLDCTPEEIKYHMSRYNDSTPMSKSQRSFIELGEESAKKIDAIYAMDFFDRGYDNYTTKDHTSGSVRAVIIESVMSCNYFDDWKKETNKACVYLKDNATDDAYEKIEDYAERLEDAIGDGEEFYMVRKMFNRKNTFLFFKLFDVFSSLTIDNEPIDDTRFVDFMDELRNNLHTKYVGEDSWDTLNASRSTKDKPMIERKISLLTNLMKHYLGIENVVITDVPVTETVESIATEDVVVDSTENVVDTITESNVETNDNVVNVDNVTDTDTDAEFDKELMELMGKMTDNGDEEDNDEDDDPIYEENLVIADILNQKNLIVTNNDITVYMDEVSEMLDRIDNVTMFDDENVDNLNSLVCAYAYLYNNDYDDDVFAKWLSYYCSKNNYNDLNTYAFTDKLIKSAQKYAEVMA